jgi:CheY-like chemotaxis protein
MVGESLSGVTNLISALAWPLVVLTIFLLFKGPIGSLIKSVSNLSFKAAGVEGTITVQKNVESALTAAAASRSTSGTADTAAVITGARTAASRAVNLLGPGIASRPRFGLWVDDEPVNNKFERAAMEQLGIHFDICRTTEEAIARLDEEEYSIVISDMARPPDMRAGLDLLDALRKRKKAVPCVIYAGSATPEEIAETKKRGGFGQTDDPNELVTMVAKALETPG